MRERVLPRLYRDEIDMPTGRLMWPTIGYLNLLITIESDGKLQNAPIWPLLALPALLTDRFKLLSELADRWQQSASRTRDAATDAALAPRLSAGNPVLTLDIAL